MLAQHVNGEADVTVGAVEVPADRAREFGVLSVDRDYRITRFEEKPERPRPIPGREGVALASMGIYVFSFEFLERVLAADAADESSDHDFGRNVIPGCIHRHRAMAYVFQDHETGVQHYWRDVGNVDAFYEANLELTHPEPELNLYDSSWPIWTYQEQAPPARFISTPGGPAGKALDTMVSGGRVVEGATVRGSLLFSNVHVGEGSELDGAVVLPDTRIGPGCRLRQVVVDEN